MPQPASAFQPRVSRETRRLLLAAAFALLALWLFARIRFTDAPPASTPVSPLLNQLVIPPRLSEHAIEIGRVQARVAPALVAAAVSRADAAAPTEHFPALRIPGGLAVALLAPGDPGETRLDLRRMATDRATGLTLVDTEAARASVALAPWIPDRPLDGRYLLATTTSAAGVWLRPVYVAALVPASDPAWGGPIWTVPPAADLTRGAFVFTLAGSLAGLVADSAAGLAIVPPETLRAEIDRLRNNPDAGRGVLGLEVQPLTPALAAATGASTGVAVAWVDPAGPAAGLVSAGDVIEQSGGQPLETVREWTVRTARMAPGESLALRVRRHGEAHDFVVTAVVLTPPEPRAPVLGLALRPVPDGSEVLSVARDSAADCAGLPAGDVITLAGDTARPRPQQVRAAFATAPEGGPLVVAVTRGGEHRLLVLER